MLVVPLPELMVPLEIVHVYTAPVPALDTEAALPVEPVHTEELAVIAAFGELFMTIDLLPEVLQPLLFVTITFSVTVPEAPAVNWMLLPDVEEVMIPLMIDHA